MKKFAAIVWGILLYAGTVQADQEVIDKNKKLVSELVDMVSKRPSENPNKELIRSYESLVEKANAQIEYLKNLEKNYVALNDSLEAKIKEMELRQEKMNQVIAAEKEVQDSKTKKVAIVYENMQPQKAALIIKGLDESMATSILQKLNPRQAGRIMEALPQEQSLKYTKMILSWNAQPKADQIRK